jgi:hypothetical protein
MMASQTLEQRCADVILKALGEKPELIQELVGRRALEHLEVTIRKEEKKKAVKKLKIKVATEFDVLVPSMITDIIVHGMGENNTPFFMLSSYRNADPELVERAWVIAKKAVETVGNERFHFNFAV